MPDSFVYQAFRLSDDRRTAFFDYTVVHDGQQFDLTETLKFPVALHDSAEQRASLRAVHLALGVSYYKIFTPGTITHPYKMDASEAGFWNDVWRNGLGEFLYVNNLAPDTLAKFIAQDGEAYEAGSAGLDTSTRSAILAIGGGKDSIVAGEALKQLGIPISGFVMATGEQLGQAKAVTDTMGISLQVVERTLDKQLLALQELPEARKGHVPISLIFALVGTALAIATDASYLVVGNEASASIPRHTSEHGAVNHQWSKSFGAEEQVQRFIHTHITSAVTYFSAVRELTSVAIAKLFARYPQYLEVFTSDNTVFRIDPGKRPNARCSVDSPKSLSSFILLAPWLKEDDLIRAFGKNFLDDASLETLFWELLGIEGEQPLDCVGTTDELVLSLNLLAQQGKFTNSHLLKRARERRVISDKDWQSALDKLLELQPEHVIPAELAQSFHALFTEALQR